MTSSAPNRLTPQQFGDFWRAIHFPSDRTAKPFDWQTRLASRVADEGWPEMLDIPTGLGKTTALDIAVYNLALALQDGRNDVPHRVFMIIDRRVVVDQSFEHARIIQSRLETATDGILARVANVLMPEDLTETAIGSAPPAPIPLVVGRMRGGVNWSWRWLDRPDQPAIIVGTIDQIGSRLLFGGYGVGRNLRSIDAALAGCDSLILVDEAHLARPFITTLQAVNDLVDPSEPLTTSHPPKAVVMSATNVDPGQERFTIDLEAELRHPLAHERMVASKNTHLLEARISVKNRIKDTAAVLATSGHQLGQDHDLVGIVCNTVAVARAVFAALQDDHGVASDDIVLITGRQRQVDRDAVWETWEPRLKAGRERQIGPTRYAVATQTIEVGADLDFSAMVTESASFDAVAQRLGRLNRQGKWQRATAVVVHSNRSDDDDPVYGPARNATWLWLCTQSEPASATPRSRSIDLSPPIDMGPMSLRQLHLDMDDATRSAVVPHPAPTPHLFPWMLDAWVQTSPQPLNQPPLQPFLHGRERGQPSVEVLWRHVGSRRDSPTHTRAGLRASVEVLPPSPAETIEVPLWAARAWMAHAVAVAAEVADVESARMPDDAEVKEPTEALPTIVMRDGATHDGHLRLLPGDRVVAPTWLGGCDTHGWNPVSPEPVVDVADLTTHNMPAGRWRSRNLVLRLDTATLSPLLVSSIEGSAAPDEHDREWQQTVTDLVPADGERPRSADVRAALEALHDAAETSNAPHSTGLSKVTRQLLAAVRNGDVRTSVHIRDDLEASAPTSNLVLARTRAALDIWIEDRSVQSTSSTGIQVTLKAHQQAVGDRAHAFAESHGLPENIVEAVTTAASLHDEGKRSPRFQAMLNGGGFPAAEPLAKSGMDPTDKGAFRRAREQAGYPAGMRHENHSAAAVHAALATHPERELITHLVASHHGYGRPFAQAVEDPLSDAWTTQINGEAVTIDSSKQIDWEQPTRFLALNQRFGPWGLALLESIVRLADIGCSEEGS